MGAGPVHVFADSTSLMPSEPVDEPYFAAGFLTIAVVGFEPDKDSNWLLSC